MIIKVSEGSKKRCREKFPIKRIGKLINSAVSLLELVPVETIISECIYDPDNTDLYNVLLYLVTLLLQTVDPVAFSILFCGSLRGGSSLSAFSLS